jgi:hypothetical protein
MTESEWSSGGETLPEKPRRRIPMWVWGCGGCAVLAMIAMGALVVFGVRYGAKAFDQDAQWEAIEQVIEIDDPRPEMMVIGTGVFIPNIDLWQLQGADGRMQVQLFHAQGSHGEDLRKELFGKGESVNIPGMGTVGRFDVEEGTIDIQGRTLDCMRYFSVPADEAPEETETGEPKGVFDAIQRSKLQSVIVVDLSPEGSSEVLIANYLRIYVRERISDEEVIEFFEPFHVGPDR